MNSRSFTPGAKWSRVASVLLVLAVVLAGIGAIAASWIPFELLQAKVRGMSKTGETPFFNHDFYLGMRTRLRWIAALSGGTAMCLFLSRDHLAQLFQRLKSDFTRFSRDIRDKYDSLPLSHRMMLALLVIIGALFRLRYLFQPMRYDESYTFLRYATHPFYAALSLYDAPNNHLFHTLLVRTAYLVFGNHPWAFRLPALFAGLCAIPATYAASRTLYRGGGLLAAGLTAASSPLIDYSTNARGYTIVTLIVLLLVPVAAYLIHHKNYAAWLAFVVLSATGFYTIPIMLYPFAALVAWMLICQTDTKSRRGEVILATGMTMMLTAALYMPVFAVSGPAAVFANGYVAPLPIGALVRKLPPSFASTWWDWNRDWPWYAINILAAGFAGSLLLNRRACRTAAPLVAALVLTTLPLLILQRVVPFERVWLFALPVYLISSAAGLSEAFRFIPQRIRLRRLTSAVLVVAVTLFLGTQVLRSGSISAMNYGQHLGEAAAFLKPQLRPGDLVLAKVFSDEPARYYFYTEGVPLNYFQTAKPKRIIAIVNDVTSDRLTDVLESNLPRSESKSVDLLARFESVSLYEIQPK